MLSQDNSPSPSPGSKFPLRVIISSLSALTLAGLGLLATTTPLQWHLPSLDRGDATAPAKNAVVATKLRSQKTRHAALPVITSAFPAKQLRKPQYKAAIEGAPGDVDFQSVKLVVPSTPLAKAAPRRIIKQPGDNIVINQLPDDHTVPVSSGGMPEFYQVILEPKGRKARFGLMQRTARRNFGYDQQDIFIAEVPDGAYVLHCHRSDIPVIRAMCWRELQVSDDQWVQYRFPRNQLKDWWKIEQKVRANIG